MNIVKEIDLMEEELEKVALPILRRFYEETGCLIEEINIENIDTTDVLDPIRKYIVGKLICRILIPSRA